MSLCNVQELSLLERVCEDQGWIQTTLTAIQEAAAHLAVIESGPLGLFAVTDPRKKVSQQPLGPIMPPWVGGGSQQNLLQVDGLGSLLLLPQPSIVIGGAGNNSSCDLNLLTDSVVAPLVMRVFPKGALRDR